MLFLGHPFSWSLLVVPAIMLLTALFALGVGLVVATLGAFFHDVKLTYGVLLTAWFYATPIIYPLEILPEEYRGIVHWNPLFYPLRLFRDAVFDGSLSSGFIWLTSTVICLGTASIGWWIFTRSRSTIEYRL